MSWFGFFVEYSWVVEWFDVGVGFVVLGVEAGV